MNSLTLLLVFGGCLVASSAHSKALRKESLRHERVQEILAPLHSITPLMCEPVFNKDELATWYKNGEPVGQVESHSNFIYEQRPLDLKELPEVGFLIVPRVTLEDEGDYWCETKAGTLGKVYRLRVAFIELFNENQQLRIHPPVPELGQSLTIDCPHTRSHPKAVASWRFNDEVIDFSNGRIEVTSNGSLLIRRFKDSDIGFYSCTLTNFAGHTTAQVQLFSPLLYSLQNDASDNELVVPLTGCPSYFRNGVLWFLIGCLSTSCIVLIYLMVGIVCYNYTRRSNRFAPLQPIFRLDPSLAPGFRKPVAPIHDYFRNQNASSYTEAI